MTTKKRLVGNILLGIVFLFAFLCFIFRVKGAYTVKVYQPGELVSPFKDEDFDISLMRLNTMAKLEAYCDSLFETNRSNRTYPGLVAEVIRKKFFHGYSSYDENNNAIGYYLSVVTKKGLAAIVIPDDIVKYPNAACSQQSIVGMELFKKKSYPVRKITMWDTVYKAGHFAYEVFYDKDWHFFDTNQEPDGEILKKYNRPSVAFLAAHPDIVAAAYHKRDQAFFQRLIMSSKVGPVNKFPAPYAYIFQKSTKFLTHFGWAFVWILILVYNRQLTGQYISRLFFLLRIKKKKKQLTPYPVAHLHEQKQKACV